MAEQSLTPENLESYSTEAISNFSKAIEDFADVITEIKSEDANIAVFNSISVMIDGRKRRLADIANVEAPNDPLNLEVMVYSKDNLETVMDTIEESGFPTKLKEKKGNESETKRNVMRLAETKMNVTIMRQETK